MEELVVLQYGSFATLDERAKHGTQRMGCSKSVTRWALWGQLYLDELRREHMAWNITHNQEWVLYLLKNLLHNAAAMQQKERERTNWRYPPSSTKWASWSNSPCTPTCQDASRSTEQEVLDITEQVYMQGEYVLTPQWTPPPPARRVHDGATTGAEPAHG